MLNVKLQDVKQTDDISGHAIAGHENARRENASMNMYWHILHRHVKQLLPRIVPTHFPVYIEVEII